MASTRHSGQPPTPPREEGAELYREFIDPALRGIPLKLEANVAGVLVAQPPRYPPRSDCGLSPQQIDVLRLAADGLTDEEIADRLCISVSAAKHRFKVVYQRLGINRLISPRAAAVAIGLRRGWIR